MTDAQPDNECSICLKRGKSVIPIDHGDKRLYMCSYSWNEFIEDLFLGVRHEDGSQYMVMPESCEQAKNV